MQASQLPAKLTIPFANAAGAGFIRSVPTASQIGINSGAASYTDGFPPVCFSPVGSGGIPPAGQDFNGVLNAITAWTRWQAAGGTVPFDSAFALAVGGYPKGAIVQSTASGVLWLNTADGNSTDPDGGGAANWVRIASTTTGRLNTIVPFTTAGTFSWTCPTGVTLVRVRCIGGGGGSGTTGGAGGAGGRRSEAHMIRRLLATLLIAALPTLAVAQSAPSWISYGYVPTAGELRAAFASKQDTLTITPLALSGGTMRGKLTTAAPTVNGAMFALLPGIAPTTPNNGDVWATSAAFFGQINGQTIQFASQGSVAAETARAQAAESANATAISNEVTRATGAEALLVPKSRQILAGTGLAGGGDLSADRTVSLGSIASSTILANLTGSSAAPVGNTLSAILDNALGSAQGTVAYRGSTGWAGLAPGTSGQVLTTGGTGANPSWAATSTGSTAQPATRQTVSTGPASSGLPSFLPASSGSLSLTAQNVSSTTPLIATAAQGFGSTPNVSYTYTSNPTWSSLAASSTVYLYVNASTGATGSTTLQPIYQYGGTPSTTSGQFTFDYSPGAMQGYMGNGTAAVAAPLVFVGEATTSASAVTATVAYAYNGYYDSGYTNTLAASATRNHNIGLPPDTTKYIVKNITADVGCSPGQVVANGIGTANGNFTLISIYTTRTALSIPNLTNWQIVNASSGAVVNMTAANWAYRFVAQRGW
ncbi:hypothetical protein Q8W71_13855 [Methylobacterium sp. NEAU 140]|uniref:glycine-rich domain-containing protein n=1 Tax=Methylobacterium sp. NEAU 140 TaxID=3064945 RepID=UPI0027343F27|nr:hypothetical protein [Methylobacterium sp. NEAU 140]MDP4023716.1 hypothetical protein [Methylobacterium sp. NEAU 140]